MENKLMNKKHIKGAILISLLCLVVIAVMVNMSSPASAYGSIDESSDTIKVFVGDISESPDNYTVQRMNYLTSLVNENPLQIVTAVVNLSDYYEVADIIDMTNNYDDIVVNRIFMWPEGETGRLSLYVKDGNIVNSIKTYISQVEEIGFENDSQSAADFQRFLNGEYGVFAITVTTSAVSLEKLMVENSCCDFADIKYNPDIETYASSKSKTTTYIELPSKPDGTK